MGVVVFVMHLCPFWYESMVIGGVFGFRCMTLPPPYFCGTREWIDLGFSWNCRCFFLESDRDGAFFGLLSLWGGCFRFRCVTPSMFFPCGGWLWVGCGV